MREILVLTLRSDSHDVFEYTGQAIMASVGSHRATASSAGLSDLVLHRQCGVEATAAATSATSTNGGAGWASSTPITRRNAATTAGSSWMPDSEHRWLTTRSRGQLAR